LIALIINVHTLGRMLAAPLARPERDKQQEQPDND
jgi:hypothetical protein